MRPADVQHAVDDDRRGLELAGDAGLERPLRGELAGVGGVICVNGLCRRPV